MTDVSTETDADAYVIKVGVRPSASAPGKVTVRGSSPKAAATEDLLPSAERDLEEAARSLGRPVADLREEAAQLPAFEALADQLQQIAPGFVLATGVERVDGALVHWIDTPTRPTQKLIAEIEQSEVAEVEVRYGAGASAEEVEKASETWSAAARSERTALAHTASRYDPLSQRLVFEYSPAPGATAEQVHAALDAAFKASAGSQHDGLLPIAADVSEVRVNALTLQRVVQGGRNLDRNGAAWCTSGFTARHTATGNWGVTTAGHCGDQLTYNGHAGVINPTAVNSSSAIYDAQFHRTLAANGHSTNNQFRATATEDRVPSAVQNAPVGTTTCHWGRTSGYSCGTVTQTNICVDGTCGLDRARGTTCRGGDSGGPWFYSSIARGTHVGILDDNTCVFTRIGRVQNSLGVTLLR